MKFGFFSVISVIASINACNANTVNHGDYVISHSYPSAMPIVSNQYYSARGPLYSNRSIGDDVKSRKLSFEIYSDDFFIEDQASHIAIAVRAGLDMPTTQEIEVNNFRYIKYNSLRGRGIIIGSAMQYPNIAPGCGPTKNPMSVTFESYWTSGNCVMGWTESPTLKNSTWYKIEVESEVYQNGYMISSKVYEKPNDYEPYKLLWAGSTFDYSKNDSVGDKGFFIVPVHLSNNQFFKINIRNLTESIE